MAMRSLNRRFAYDLDQQLDADHAFQVVLVQGVLPAGQQRGRQQIDRIDVRSLIDVDDDPIGQLVDDAVTSSACCRRSGTAGSTRGSGCPVPR